MSNPFSDDPEVYTTKLVTFSRPFTLGAAPEVYPAGVYQVETKQQVWEASGHSGLRRTSTVLVVPTPTGSFSRQVIGTELDHAIARDAADAKADSPSS
jgi:hypothetical protein